MTDLLYSINSTVHVSDPLLDSPVCPVSLLYWGAQNRTPRSRRGLTSVEQRGGIRLP